MPKKLEITFDMAKILQMKNLTENIPMISFPSRI